MSLTKKHFELMAKIIRHHVTTQDNKLYEALKTDTTVLNTTDMNARLGTLKMVAQDLALMCASENKLFDKARFMEACGFDASSEKVF